MNGAKHLLGAICYWSGIDLLFYFLNRRAKRVVTFHSVLPDALCEGMDRLPVAQTVSSFRWIVREATRYLKTDADLKSEGTLTITFDDGYLNQYEVVPEVLADEGVCVAIVFVSDDVRQAEGAGSALGPDRRSHSTLCFSKEYERLRLTGMSVVQMDDLHRRGWKIGYHTKSHRALAKLTEVEKRIELKPPSWLKDKIISYPFGKPWNVDKESIRIAEEYGYECAYSNQCENDGRHERWFLPRMVLFEDRYWIHFELSGAKYFFKYRRLLPRIKW